MKSQARRIPYRRLPAWLQRWLRRSAHTLWYGMAVVVALMAVLYVGARAILPGVAERRAELEVFLSSQSGFNVHIEHLETYWDGLHPGLILREVRVEAPNARQPTVRLEQLRITPRLLPLIAGRLEIRSLTLKRPSLTLERLADGRFRVWGLPPVDIENADPQQTVTFSAWLFRQPWLAIEDGELQWVDRRARENLALTRVSLQLRNNGERHRLGLRAVFPPGVCEDCSLVVDVEGNPFLAQTFAGEMYLRGKNVDLARLPRAVGERLPPGLRGVFSLELWSEWTASRPTAIRGAVVAEELRMPVQGFRAPVVVQRAATQLRWNGDLAGDFRLGLTDLQLITAGAQWSAGDIEYAQRKQHTSIRVDTVDLAGLRALATNLRLAEAELPLDAVTRKETFSFWEALQPAGYLRELRAQFVGPLSQPDEFILAANVDELALAATAASPGVRGVSGALTMRQDRGEFSLDMRAGEFALPTVFRAPLPIARAGASIRWQRQQDAWLVVVDDIQFANEDFHADGRLKLVLPVESGSSPHLSVRTRFHNVNGAHAGRYYPAQRLSPSILAWMDRAFVGGTVPQAELEIDGKLEDFPFNNGAGRFRVRASVRDGVYRFLPGWEPLRGITSSVTIDGPRLTISGHGQLGKLDAHQVAVWSEDMSTVHVAVSVRGPVSESLRVLHEAKPPPGADSWKSWLPLTLEAEGDGALSLSVVVPPHAPETLHGEYRFRQVHAALAGSAVAASAAEGVIGFTEHGVYRGNARAQWLGGDTVLAVATPHEGETVAVLRGSITAQGLAPLLGAKLAPQVSGLAPWRLRLRFTSHGREIEGEADLSALKSVLPAPLNRPDGLLAEKLVLRSTLAPHDRLPLSVHAGQSLSARFLFARAVQWRFVGAQLVFDELDRKPEAAVTSTGLHIRLRLDELDLDKWSAFASGDPFDLPEWLARVGVETRQLVFLERELGSFAINLSRARAGWHGTVRAAAASGNISLAPGAIALDLDTLVLPAPKPESDPQAGIDPRRLPALTLDARAFRFAERNLGALKFVARPYSDGWHIERCRLQMSGNTRVNANGRWRVDEKRMSSDFSIQLKSDELALALAQLGMPGQLQGGEVEADGSLSWSGRPSEFGYSTLNGHLDLRAEGGRFLQIDPGAGRLFGILDLSAVFRVLTLNAGSLFGKGFAFDSIRGKFRIERGNLRTDRFDIKGPSARVAAEGRVGLGAEDFDLKVDVYPNVSSSVTLGSLVLGGPQAALWSMLASKLFKRPIDASTRIGYRISGPWKDPKIVREKPPTVAPTAVPGR